MLKFVKRLLLTLMVFVMLTPSLACAGIMCPPMSNLASVTDMPCCPKCPHETGVKFFKDCSGIDLQSVYDHIALNKQVMHSHDLFVMADSIRLDFIIAVSPHGIRAPPLDYGHSSFPPIYLSTQRLRI